MDQASKQSLNVSGSPFNVKVNANVADPAFSGAYGVATTLATAGRNSSILIPHEMLLS